MTISSLRRKYPEKICICFPHLRDAANNHVLSWQLLEAVDSVEAARVAIEQYDLGGMEGAVAIPTTERLAIDGDLAARYCRVFFGMG